MSYAYQCTSWMMIHSHVQRHVQIEVFLNAQKLIWTCRQSYCKLYVNFVTYSQWTYKYKTDNKRKDSKKSEDTANERERESLSNCHTKAMQQLREVGGRNQWMAKNVQEEGIWTFLCYWKTVNSHPKISENTSNLEEAYLQCPYTMAQSLNSARNA